MIVRGARGPFIALAVFAAAVVAGAVVVWRDRPWVLPQLAFVGVLLFVHYLYLSRRLLELRLDEVIYRTLFKTLRVRLEELGSIHYERMVARRGEFALVLRLKESNRPVAILSPRGFPREDWTTFVGELERRSGLRLNVPSHREIPKPAPEPARPRDLFFVVLILGGSIGLYTVNQEFPYLEAFPGVPMMIGAAVFVVTLVLVGRAREKFAPWGWQEGAATVWLGVVGLAALVAYFAVASMKFTNGALDRSPVNYARFTVLSVDRYNYTLGVRPAFASTTLAEDYYWLTVSWDDWETSDKGDVVLVDMRPGFLHLPWVAGYRTCGDNKCRM